MLLLRQARAQLAAAPLHLPVLHHLAEILWGMGRRCRVLVGWRENGECAEMKRVLLCLGVVALCSCGASEETVIRPVLMFTIRTETGLDAPRDLAVDDSGNILVFDYDDYTIHEFTPSGEVLATFGGPEGEAGGFRHLMAIRALGDDVLALDAGALSIFDSSGQLRATRAFSDTIICDHPRLHPNGEWAGEWIVEETAEKVLTYRDASGLQLSRVAGFALDEFFPGIQPGGMFFIKPTQLRSYVYDFSPDGRLVWAVSDQARIFRVGDQDDSPLFSADWHPRPFPATEIQALQEQQASLNPPLFMNVPRSYQLIQHLLVDESGDIWIYVTSVERTGLVHLSDQGVEKGFHAVEADFDLLSVRVAAAHGRFYFMAGERDATGIFVADRP